MNSLVYTVLCYFVCCSVGNGFIVLKNDNKPSHLSPLSRLRRYIGLNKKYKLNRRYQECRAPGDVTGHCKHAIYCSVNFMIFPKDPLQYLCVIEKTFVGVCCPDDIVSNLVIGSRIISDLPAAGDEYDKETSSDSGCGITINGKSNKSDKRRWPWLAALYDSEGHTCGGVLITDRHVLTAAHCTDGRLSSDLKVRLGEYDYNREDETRAREFKIMQITEHEEFELSTYRNDIALLTLEKPTTFNTYIWPICLPPLNRSYVNETAIVAGWGRTAINKPASNLLLDVAVPIWDHERCVDSFVQTITGENICAAGYEGGKDACQGDSGGPLLYQLPNGRWVTIGIVSWGIGCGIKGKPGIYTKVESYIPWILVNIAKEGKNV